MSLSRLFSSKPSSNSKFIELLHNLEVKTLKDKYETCHIEIKDSFTDAEFLALEKKLEEIELAWKSALDFEGYLRFQLQLNGFVNDPEQKRAASNKFKDKEEEETFTQGCRKDFELQLKEPMQCGVTITKAFNSKGLNNFLIKMIEQNRMFFLCSDEIILEAETINTILGASNRRNSDANLKISFSKTQDISDSQGREFLRLISKFSILRFSGVNLQHSTAVLFSQIKREKCEVDISNNEDFSESLTRQLALQNIAGNRFFDGEIVPTAEEIEMMTEEMRAGKKGNIISGELKLDSYSNNHLRFDLPQWGGFFQEFMKGPVIYGIRIGSKYEYSRAFVSSEVMSSLISSTRNAKRLLRLEIFHPLHSNDLMMLAEVMRHHQTINHLDINAQMNDSASLCELILAIRSNNKSALKSLSLNYTAKGETIGLALKELLIHNKTLESLTINVSQGADQPHGAIAEALAVNTGLKSLSFSNYGIFANGLIVIGRGLERNKTLRHLDLAHFTGSPGKALQQFTWSMQINSGLTKLNLALQPSPNYSLQSEEAKAAEMKRDASQIKLFEQEKSTVLKRNATLQKRDELEALDEYFLTAITLFQSLRSGHQYLNYDFVHVLLSMLVPPVADPKRLDLGVRLIESNLEEKEWKTRVVLAKGPFGGTERVTLFKRWENENESVISACREARLNPSARRF